MNPAKVFLEKGLAGKKYFGCWCHRAEMASEIEGHTRGRTPAVRGGRCPRRTSRQSTAHFRRPREMCLWRCCKQGGFRDKLPRILALPGGAFFRTLKGMEVQLTPDQKAFVRHAIESGRLHGELDAVQEALAMWEERERTRAEILAAVDGAEASLARGEGRDITEQSMRDLAGEVKKRGRARLAAERHTTR